MSESGALAAAPVEAVEEGVVGTAHPTATVEETTVDMLQPTQETAETTGGREAGASGKEVPRLEPGNQKDTKERDEAIARIRKSNLPPVMRERLAAVMEASESARLDVAVCLEAIEETLPEFLRGGRGNFTPSLHPLGNAFFHGTEEMTDAEAETLATRQLERSGLLRGQRVSVAD